MTTAPKPTYDLALAEADYPAWDGRPDRTLLLCSHPRSGSTLLGEVLYFAGEFGCPLEYFHRGFRPAFAARWQAPDLSTLVTASHRFRTNASGLFSCKLFWRDVEDLLQELAPSLASAFLNTHAEQVAPAAYRDLHDFLQTLFPHPTFIHLKRKDRVRMAISALIATQTRQWRAIPGQGSTTPKRVAEFAPTYDYDRIAGLLAYGDYCQAHWTRYFQVNALTPLTATYEQLVGADQQPLTRLLADLGHTGDLPPARMQRQADERSEQWVARFLTDHLARSGTN